MKFLECIHMGVCICVRAHTQRSFHPPTTWYDPFYNTVFQGLNITQITKLFPPYLNDLSQLAVFLIYNTLFATTKKMWGK